VHRQPKVALVSVGIGRVQRGFERYFAELHDVLEGEIPVTLFKSAGAGNGREIVPPMLPLATRFVRAAPLHWLERRARAHTEYYRDCLAFAVMMAPRLARERFDVIHCIDPPLAFAMRHVKRLARLGSRILFTEGSVIPPDLYPRVDHIHHVAHDLHASALAHGIATGAMTLIPCGVRTSRFPVLDDKAELRRHYGIAPETFVILAVSAVKREHKRVDHIIEEASRLEGDVLLWLDGNPEEGSVVELARQRLGKRVRITHVPSSEVASLYRVADVLVHAALQESFGLAIVEAACSGTPVLAHDTPHFEWLLGDRSRLVDMQARGMLGARLRAIAAAREREAAAARALAGVLRPRFDWAGLVPGYLEMYARVAAGGPAAARSAPRGASVLGKADIT
jgi:glycosyltransferase involved in cell wall biosynthesis